MPDKPEATIQPPDEAHPAAQQAPTAQQAQPPAQQPPVAAPPAAFVPVSPPRRAGAFGRGFGLGAGAGLGAGGVLLVLGVIGSLLSALVFGAAAAAAGQASGPRVNALQTVWGSDTADRAHTVLAVPISGAIQADGSDGFALTASTYGYELARTLDALTADDYAGVVLLMNTPGGTINGSRAIADAVERYQSRTGRKVVAYVQGMSASGGMYAMAGADRIIADHGSLVGSIGVIYGPFERYRDVVATSGSVIESGVTTTGGITVEYLTQGTGKDFGNPYREMTARERTVFTQGISNEYRSFVEWVSKHRGIPATTITDELGAFIFDPKTAISHKLIDAELGPDEGFRVAVTVMGLDPATARIAQRSAPSALEQLLGASARVYGYQATAPAGTPASSVICAGAPQPLVWHGPVTSYCG